MKSFFLFIILFSIHTVGNAHHYFQTSEYQLLNTTDGLCNNTVSDIEQDPFGILWISTDAGICRYDGMTFFTRVLADKEPVAVANLMTTTDGLVWSMAKYRPRLVCFDRMTGSFRDVRFEGDDLQPSLINVRVVSDQLMAVTPNALYRLEARQDEDAVIVTPQKLLATQTPFVNIYGQGDYVYMSTAEGSLVLYQLSTRKTQRIPQETLLIRDPKHIRHSYLGDDHLWLCSDREGLICYSLNEHIARRIPITEPNHGIREARVFDIARVNGTTYIVSTKSSILRLKFDSSLLTRSDYQLDDLTPERSVYGGLLSECINCIYYDNLNRTLWVGTQGSGLMKLRLWSDDVFHIDTPKEMGKLSQLAQGADGYLWAATETGLYRSDSRDISPDLRFTRWTTCHGEGNHCLFRDGDSNLWVGYDQGEVKYINTHTGEEQHFVPTLPDGHTNVGRIQRLLLDTNRNLWIVTETGLTVFFIPTRQTVAHLDYAQAGYEVNCLTEDNDGHLWLGTTRGLRHCTLNGAKMEMESGYEERIGMNPGYVRALYTNRYNQLFASYTNKIITIDGKDRQVTGCMLVNQELLDGHVQCFIDDRNGNTWMGSNTGISTYNNRTGQVFHYDASNNYFDVSYLNDGELIWANATGILYFSPRKLKQDAEQKLLRLSGLEVNNVKLEIGLEVNGQVILDRPAYLMDEFDLQYNNNNLVITFTNMKFSNNPERVYFRLLPRDKEWQTGWNSRVKLSSLAPGSYTLEVRPAMPFDADVEVLQLPIRIRAHWALTGWAFALYALLILGLGFGIHYYIQHKTARRRMHIEEKEDLEEALDTEKEKREEVVRNQRLRDNIRHTLAQEMRSPLALAVAPLKEMIHDEGLAESARQKAQIAYHNTVYLQDICNQILNIYQQENGDGQLRVAAYTVSDLADEAVRNTQELLHVSEVKLDYNKSSRFENEVWADRSAIVFVLSNALSNAYRRLNYTGTVSLRVEITEYEGRPCCLYIVHDVSTRSMIDSYSFRLSEDDFTPLEKQLHPEIGLEAMREVALNHGGDILIRHEMGQGTEMRLYLPFGHSQFDDNPHVLFVEPDLIVPDEDEENYEIEKEEKAALTGDVPRIEAAPVTPETKYTVLVIEDNSDIRLYLKVLLATRYNVLLAENGQEGIRVARKEEPDLILMDIMMPVMDGLECCRILKDDLKTCHIPVIMLTALTSDEDVVKGLETGADDYVLKPFNPDILRSKIKNLIQSRVDLKRIYTRLLMTSTPAETTDAPDAGTLATSEKSGLEDPFIAVILEEVKANLQNPDFSVKRLAERMNMSQPTLYRKVKQLTSYTIIELIRGVRLKQAAELLRTRKYSVQEVAEMVGYNDVPTFRKHFIDLYGTTPSTFNS